MNMLYLFLCLLAVSASAQTPTPLPVNPPPYASVTITWPAVVSPNVAGYRMYYGVAAHSYTNKLDVGHTNVFAISNLVWNTTYHMAGTSYSSNDLESAFSPELIYTPLLASTNPPPPMPAVKLSLTLNMTWAQWTGGPSYFLLLQSSANCTNWTTIATLPSTATSYQLNNVSLTQCYRLAYTNAP